MPGTTGITLWNLRNTPGTFAPVGTLYDNNWTIRDTGVRWQNLMSEFETDVTTMVNPDGTISFTGFFGDYEVTIGGQTFDLQLAKGDASYSLVVAPGDYNADGTVDAADYTVWRDTLGRRVTCGRTATGMKSSTKVIMWCGSRYLARLTVVGRGSALATVPEPASIVILAAAGLLFFAKCPRKGKTA